MVLDYIQNSYKYQFNYFQVLEKIGVGDLFTSSSNLSVLAVNNDIKLGGALHKARIEVTEEGTRAAAATTFFSFRSSRPLEPAQFKCNHPFIYLIFDKTEQSVLFTGVFRRPFQVFLQFSIVIVLQTLLYLYLIISQILQLYNNCLEIMNVVKVQ